SLANSAMVAVSSASKAIMLESYSRIPAMPTNATTGTIKISPSLERIRISANRGRPKRLRGDLASASVVLRLLTVADPPGGLRVAGWMFTAVRTLLLPAHALSHAIPPCEDVQWKGRATREPQTAGNSDISIFSITRL